MLKAETSGETSQPQRPVPTTLANEESLLARARARDETAFEELVGRHEDRLFRLAMHLTRDQLATQEILQQTFLTVWRGLPAWDGTPPFASWLYRLALRAARLPSRAPDRPSEPTLDSIGPTIFDQAVAESGRLLRPKTDWSQCPDGRLRSDALREHIRASVDALPSGLRTVFLLRDVEELSADETAETLGLSVVVVDARLHRSRLALREAIGQFLAG